MSTQRTGKVHLRSCERHCYSIRGAGGYSILQNACRRIHYPAFFY
jgi:hypothetical protein